MSKVLLAALLAFAFGAAQTAAADDMPTAICPRKMAIAQRHNCFIAAAAGVTVTGVELVSQVTGEVATIAVADQSQPGMYTFDLLASLDVGDYSVNVRYGDGGAETKTTEVELVGEAAMVLLEMDKAMYKPSQTVLVRALALRPADLTPLADRTIELAVLSPKGLTLLKTSGNTDEFGVARFEYPLASEPLLGEHIARATAIDGSGSAAVNEVSFMIDEYVLPRYEVNLTCDQPHLVAPNWNDAASNVDVTGSISAKYTFGEPVRGKVMVSLLRQGYSYSGGGRGGGVAIGVAEPDFDPGMDVKVADAAVSSPGGGGSGVLYETLGSATGLVLSGDGAVEYRVRIPRQSLSMGQELLIEASVVDEATGERQNATMPLPVVYQGSELLPKLSSLDGSEVFRPGLPALVRLGFSQPGGGAAPDDVIEGSTFNVRLQRCFVDWDFECVDTSTTVPATSLVGGASAVVELAMPVEESSCCDPLASVANEKEYRTKMGCCASRAQIYIERDGNRLWGEEAQLCLSRAYSPTGIFLSVLPPASSGGRAQLRSTVSFTTLKSDIVFFVLQGGSISHTGVASAGTQTKAGEAYEAELAIDLPANLAPDSRLVVVARTTQGVAVAGSAVLPGEGIQWPFELTARFSSEEVLPGGAVSVDFSATGLEGEVGQLFFVSLDRSAELLGARASVSGTSVLDALRRADGDGAAPEAAPRAWRQCQLFGPDVALSAEIGAGVSLMPEASVAGQEAPDDADNSWGESLGSYCPRPIQGGCSGGFGGDDIMMDAEMMPMDEDGGAMMKNGPQDNAADEAGSRDAGNGADAAGGSKPVRVRKFFPETWLWEDMALPADGQATKAVIAPDTITSWSLEAFATTPRGLAAVRSETPLLVFKPFFVEVRLPYSAIRDEILEVALAVFNYQEGSGTLEAEVQVELFGGLTLAGGETTFSLSVPEGASASSTIKIKPTLLGSEMFRITATSGDELSDSMERVLLVEPEGVEVRKTQNLVIELSGASATVEETLMPDIADEIVNGSLRASVSVVGDLLGPTIAGLERLLQIPSGCGEQNMITLAPNVYVAKYLLAIERMRPDLRRRIMKNMLIGYGRQLTYRHSDGSFSAFGESDSSGSTWLTAFVLRTFAEVHASELIAVDASVLQAAMDVLLSWQNSDGSFAAKGNVIHKEMMGGLGDGSAAESSLTSYVASAIAKAINEVPALDSNQVQAALSKAGDFLMASEPSRVYTKLLRIFALSIADLLDADEVAAAALELSQELNGGDNRYWSAADSGSQDIELTGYGVMVLSTAGKLAEAFQGARWLLQRRSASGGFHSTQDTVVALNALATYAAAVAGNVNMSVTVSSSNGVSEVLQIDADNVEVLQSVTTIDPEDAVVIAATGAGTALVVHEVVYNVLDASEAPCYEIEVKWYVDTPTASGPVRACGKRIPECASTLGEDGMWIMSVGIFTGYAPLRSSLEDLRVQGLIKRFEINGDQVDFYMDRVTSSETCLSFAATRETVVEGLQARPSSIFEYYAPEMRGSALTSFSALQESQFEQDVEDSRAKTSLEPITTSQAAASIANSAAGISTILGVALATSAIVWAKTV